MNKIIKVVLGSGVGLALLVSATPAFASTNNVLFDNGSGGQQINSGESVTLHAFVNTTIGQALESVFVSFPNATGIAQHGKCYTLNPGQEGVSPVNGWDIAVPIDNTPTAAGSWGPNVTFYGINGDPIDTQCAGSSVFATQFFPNRLVTVNANTTSTVTNNSSGIGGNNSTPPAGSVQASIAALTAQMAALQGLFAQLTTVAAGLAPKPICANLSAYAGINYGSHSAAGLQTFLMSNGQSIPAGATGYFGPQTAAALASFKLANHCN